MTYSTFYILHSAFNKMDLLTFKTTFDGVLQTYTQGKIAQAKQLIADKKINNFIDYIDTFIFSGGKRIRPYGLWLAYIGFGGQNEKAILNFWIIFELLHSMALIHDDIIDQSTKRHNALTMHSHIQTLLKGNNAEHIAQWQALLIWDLLLAWVYELRFKHHDFDEQHLTKARENVHTMIEEVILWQMIDVDMMVSGPASLALIDKKNTYKTSSYTFTRPMLTWAILAWASEHQQELIKELGNYMGMAFQMRDDYLDITFGDKTKSAFSDIQEGQQTYFTNYIFDNGSAADKKLLKASMGKKLDDQRIKELQLMFENSWAIAFGKQGIHDYSQKAKAILQQLEIQEEVKAQVLSLIHKMEKLEH